MMMDILHLSKKQIYEMNYIDYHEAMNYAIVRFNITKTKEKDKEGKTNSGTYFFPQEPGYDHDPNFVSEIIKGKKE
jgi:hypothetical protein